MKLLVRRIIFAIPLLFAITLISFLIMHLAPGDPAGILIDPKIKPEVMMQLKHNMGLDKPVVVQYFYWLKELVKGNMGYSFVTGKPVLNSILEKLPATLILSIASLVIIFICSLFLGLISAAKKNSWLDNFITITSFVGLAIPTFWLGLILMLFFSLQLNLFPSSGFLDADLINAPFYQKVINISYHLVLPLLTIVIVSIAGLTRYQRFQAINILNAEYITAAKARGISSKRILFKHAFKNAALPLVTILGLELPGLIGGAFIIEYIFAWPGMGQLAVNSVFSRDYPILMGILIFTAILIILGNLLSDLSYSLIDPRIRSEL